MSDWADWQQNRRIRNLQAEVDAAYSYASSQSRSLQAKLAQVQGSLETRLDRLAKAFDAFVELSDLRLELAVYAREAVTRHHARRLVTALAERAKDASKPAPPPVTLEDAPGYWLTPAAEALSALTRGEDAEAAIAEATARDPERTPLFLTLALTQAGLTDTAVRWLEQAFPPLGAAPTRVQRTLWLACADGTYGEVGRRLAVRRLADFLAASARTEAEDAAEREKWAQVVRGVAAGPKPALPVSLASTTELTEPLTAAARLAALRASVEKGLASGAVTTAEPFDAQDLISGLIEEGGPEEREPLRRAHELREIIENGHAAAGKGWADEAGEALVLLRGDAFGTRPGPRELALRTGARWLTAIADDLAGKATVRPPDEVTVRLGGTSVRLRQRGPVSLDEAEANVERMHAASEAPERAGLATAAAGLLLIGVGAAVSVALIVLGVPALIAGCAVWYTKRRTRLGTLVWIVAEKQRMHQQATATAETLAEHNANCAQSREAAVADRDAVHALLG